MRRVAKRACALIGVVVLSLSLVPLPLLAGPPDPSASDETRDEALAERGLARLSLEGSAIGVEVIIHDDEGRERSLGEVPLELEVPAGVSLDGKEIRKAVIGGIESDGEGTLLTTAECLLSPNRNPHLSKAEIEEHLKKVFGLDRLLWLEHGYLAGDDTDSHIDTLARLCDPGTIAYVKCDNTSDEHFRELQAMEAELRAFRKKDGSPYRLVPLPWPDACFDSEGNRLPATYANFLIINGAVLVPTYGVPQDAAALEVISTLFTDRDIIGIDCRPLILQHGSLHCVTMQYPAAVINS